MESYLKTSAITGERVDSAIKAIIALVAKNTATHEPTVNHDTIVIKPNNQEAIVMQSITLDRIKRRASKSYPFVIRRDR